MGGTILAGFLPFILVLLLMCLRKTFPGWEDSEVEVDCIIPMGFLIFGCYYILEFVTYFGILIWGTVLVSDGKLQF